MEKRCEEVAEWITLWKARSIFHQLSIKAFLYFLKILPKDSLLLKISCIYQYFHRSEHNLFRLTSKNSGKRTDKNDRQKQLFCLDHQHGKWYFILSDRQCGVEWKKKSFSLSELYVLQVKNNEFFSRILFFTLNLLENVWRKRKFIQSKWLLYIMARKTAEYILYVWNLCYQGKGKDRNAEKIPYHIQYMK